MKLKDPWWYDGSPVCPRCGSGWPVCADRNEDGIRVYSHADTCARYNWADDLCEDCDRIMKAEYGY